MTIYMKNLKYEAVMDGLYPWGVAELNDKWVLLHSNGLPKWAIFYKGEGKTIVIPCQALKSNKRLVKRKKPVQRKTKVRTPKRT